MKFIGHLLYIKEILNNLSLSEVQLLIRRGFFLTQQLLVFINCQQNNKQNLSTGSDMFFVLTARGNTMGNLNFLKS